ncbi:hypothetical protein AB0C27_07080 [Nonomuraea sp. NPDC048882]|uniref:hypothetical protein n=1 Tax=Nonomuraea sp. NPDC048882 TaxID=3154347 RepID=UPI00340127AF
MDLDSSLLKAAQFCSPHIRTEAGASLSDGLEYLEHGEWEMVLLVLEELGDAHPQPPEFWDLLADAARVMWLESHVAWYEWRGSEARNGALRAELCLVPTEEGGRKVPILPGKGLRPMWDVGQRTPEGELSVSIALLWVEGRTPLEPGECAPVRLLPLTPEHWRHLTPGDVITMHEMRPPSGTARIVEVVPPVATVP